MAYSKYKSKKTEIGRIRFDSKKEAERFKELFMLERNGKIRNLKLQHDFTLQEAYTTTDGERIRAIRYVADFTYYDCESNEFIVEDVKSKATKTDVYQMKRKMLREKFNLKVREV